MQGVNKKNVEIAGGFNGNLYHANLHNSYKNTTNNEEDIHTAVVIFSVFFITFDQE